jgi:hypothetical protein
MAKNDYREACWQASKRGTVVDANALQATENATDDKNDLFSNPIKPATGTTEEDELGQTCERREKVSWLIRLSEISSEIIIF